MHMKLRFILLCFATILCANSMKSLPTSEIVYASETVGVPMKGDFSQKGSRSGDVNVPVIVQIVDNNKVSIQFTKAVGIVEIFIDGELKEAGKVTEVGQVYTFSLEEYNVGKHLLEIKNPFGGYLYGEFIIEE